MRSIRMIRTALALLMIAGSSLPAYAGSDDAAIASALTALKGKRATVKLQSGQELTGIVAAVEDETVRLTELTGMDFFDAVVRTDSIDAVVMRRTTQ